MVVVVVGLALVTLHMITCACGMQISHAISINTPKSHRVTFGHSPRQILVSRRAAVPDHTIYGYTQRCPSLLHTNIMRMSEGNTPEEA